MCTNAHMHPLSVSIEMSPYPTVVAVTRQWVHGVPKSQPSMAQKNGRKEALNRHDGKYGTK